MRKRILIIEENEGDFQSLHLQLLMIGYVSENICWHRSIKDIQLNVAAEPQIIFIAVASPIEYYKVLISQIQEKFNHTPIIAICNTSCSEVVTKAKNLSVQDYLLKGDFDSKLLGKAIEYSITKNSLREKIEEVENIFESISDAFFA
ncbi:MAG TPA: response regulator, partial [Flavipsychrobacter sp.]|nr:response regulator [Flavipsychrobacter sp.]